MDPAGVIVAALSKRDRLCYMRAFIAPSRLFPGSSAVEQPAVNRLVAGSNPARGAKLDQRVKFTFDDEEITKKQVLATTCRTRWPGVRGLPVQVGPAHFERRSM
jgi:hypothetical protein